MTGDITETPGKGPFTERFPVLVVGGGPVGLALSGDLGWRGIRCLLVEKTNGEIVQPKQDLVGVRTMEFCRRWGIAKWVEEAPYPRDYPQDNVWVTSLAGYELGREPFPGMADEPLPPQSPQKRERCPQDMFDPVLRRFAGSFKKDVTLRYSTELLDLKEEESGVSATVRDNATGKTSTVWADYVVGTDGGSSTVRNLLGIGMNGSPVLTYTTNVMFRCTSLPSVHPKGYRYIFIGPEGVWLTIVAINGRDRWRMSIVGTAEQKTYGEPEIRQTLQRAIGADCDYQILSIWPWVRRQLVADSYGTKRIFIAGDAAHMMSPTGGFGMNTGVGDSVDLGWKLEAAVRGWGGPALLSSYEVERRPVGIRNVNEASGNLDRMLSSRTCPPPPEVFEPGPEGDAARKKYGDWFTQTMSREWSTLGIHLGYRYGNSPVIWPEDTPAPPDDVSGYVQNSLPGSRAPHVWLSDGRSTLDLFGREFVLLCLGAAPPDVTSLIAAAEKRSVPLSLVHIDEPEVVKVYERRLVLVRPDGHVAWRDDVAPRDPISLVDRVRGAHPVSGDKSSSRGRRLSTVGQS
jgi:2-polyprenyl-6-methoxyphenol hydroxylase-like FAD-dependent oxidoreductase